MKKEIEEMNKAVRCLALELPEQVFLDFFGRWTTFRDSLLTPPHDVQERAKEYLIPKYFISEPTIEEEVKEYEELKAAYIAGASSGMQWVKASEGTPPLRVGQTFSEYVPLKMYDNRFLLGRVHESAGKKSFEITSSDGAKTYFSEGSFYQIYWLDESSPSSMQEENERLRNGLRKVIENLSGWEDTDTMMGIAIKNALNALKKQQ